MRGLLRGCLAGRQRRQPPKVYSDRRLIAGLASADFIARKLTVQRVMMTAKAPATINTHQLMPVR